MEYKSKIMGGLSALSLGILGGFLLSWGLYRRIKMMMAPQFRPTESNSRSKAATSYQASHPVEVTESIAETAWPETAPSTRSKRPAETNREPATQKGAAPKAKSKSSTAPEDLTPIEGIGPKINKVLHEAGITTFAQLAATEVSRLEQILALANLRLAKADTWPEQARLAAAGDWEGLERLQNELDAGRRRDD
jgi:predicted flap endonuclease-1-like 5' DNA nuclease